MESELTTMITLNIHGNPADDASDVIYDKLRLSVPKAQVESRDKMEDPLISVESGALKALPDKTLTLPSALMGGIDFIKSDGADLNVSSHLPWYQHMVGDMNSNGWLYSGMGHDGRDVLNTESGTPQVRREPNTPSIRLTTIIQGKIIEVGGKTPNIHVLTPKRMYVVSISEEDIRKENLVYAERNMEVEYSYNPETEEESDFRFVKFIEQPAYDEDRMNDLILQESEAWKDVKDITAWVESQRRGEGYENNV